MADTTRTPATAAAQKNELAAEDTSYLDSFSGEGLDTIGANETSVGYLGMVQAGSAFISDECPAGSWRNSVTGRVYGTDVRVVPIGFRTIWNERSGEPPYNTVANYVPGSIKVQTKAPPAGQRGFTKMYNPDTGNEIKELYIYAIILPDYPEDGVLYFNPTVSSMKACKAWNTQLKAQLLPNGVQAPIFGFTWHLLTEQITNPKQPANKMTVLARVVKDVIVDKELFEGHVQPQLATIKNDLLAIGADPNAGSTEEE